MTISFISFLFVIVLGCNFITGIFGTPGGTLLMGVLLQLFIPATAMAIHGVTQLTSNVWRAWHWRKYIYYPVVPGYMIGGMISVLVFTALQIQFDLKFTYLFLGFLPFISFILPKGKDLDVTRGHMSKICGALIVGLQLTAGLSGGFFDQCFLSSPLDRRQQIATKSLLQIFAHLIKIAYFTLLLKKAATWQGLTWQLAAILVIAAIIGNSLAAKPVQKMKQENFKKYSTTILMIAGVYFLYKSAQLFLHYS